MELSEKFYRENYNVFSDTRYCLWDSVKEFSKEFKGNSNVLDAGCGNGKNIKYFNGWLFNQSISQKVIIDYSFI